MDKRVKKGGNSNEIICDFSLYRIAPLQTILVKKNKNKRKEGNKMFFSKLLRIFGFILYTFF